MKQLQPLWGHRCITVRSRQHANPLQRHLLQPHAIPSETRVFQNMNNPLLLDVGCGLSKFVLDYAQVGLKMPRSRRLPV